MKKSKLLFINRSIFKRDIFGYDFALDFYEHENSYDNFSRLWAIDKTTGNDEYVCYSTNAITDDSEIKKFLLSKIVTKIKYLFGDFYYEIKALKNGIKINHNIFKLNTPKMDKRAWLIGSSIKHDNFNRLFELIYTYMDDLDKSH